MIEIDLKISKGENDIVDIAYSKNISLLGIIGDSACGKTVLLRTISSAFTGEVSYNVKGFFGFGEIKYEFESDNYQNLSKYKYGYIPQDSIRAFIAPTVFSEIATSVYTSSMNHYDSKKKIIEWEQNSPVSEYASRSPLTLSTGERRMLLIESALLAEPDFLFIDGGISILSDTYRDRVRNLIKKWLYDNPSRKMIWAEINDEKIHEIMQDCFYLNKSKNKDISHFVNVVEAKSIIKFSSLSGGPIIKGAPIIKRADFNVRVGEVVGVVGPNGSGKSTLLKMVSGAGKIISGDVYYENESVKSRSYPGLREGIAYMPEELDVAGTYSQLSTERSTYSDDYVNNVLSYWEMSSGQQVECYLDWLIKYMPRLLILDEPSSRIEKENLIKILLKIRKNNTKMSILLATHDNDLLKILDARVLTIIDGFVG